MRCEYPNKKKSIIADGKRFAIVQKKYKDLSGKDLETSKFDLNDAERYKIDEAI